MSKARGLADLGNAYSDGALSNRNVIVNGGMQVAQRSASVSGITTGAYRSLDRWFSNLSTAGTWTISKETDAPVGFATSMKYLCTTASTAPTGMVGQHQQIIGGIDLQQLGYGTSNAADVTVGFWVKSNVVGTYACRLYNPEGTDRLISKQYTIAVSGAWEYKTITFAGDEVRAVPNLAAYGISIGWWFAAGSAFTTGSPSAVWQDYVGSNEAPSQVDVSASVNNYFQITGVQLELGDQSTPFEHRSYGDELARCQRYYQEYNKMSAAAVGYCESTTAAYYIKVFSATMRVAPTFSYTGTPYVSKTGSNQPISAISAATFTDAAFLNATAAGLTGGQGVTLTYAGSLGLKFDAEL